MTCIVFVYLPTNCMLGSLSSLYLSFYLSIYLSAFTSVSISICLFMYFCQAFINGTYVPTCTLCMDVRICDFSPECKRMALPCLCWDNNDLTDTLNMPDHHEMKIPFDRIQQGRGIEWQKLFHLGNSVQEHSHQPKFTTHRNY